MGREVEQALLGQDAEGFPQRHAAGAGAEDELRLDEAGAGGDAAIQNVLAQPIRQPVGQALRASGGLGDGNGGSSQDC
jgi:hypothetical protein